jgi:hypothetical protein
MRKKNACLLCLYSGLLLAALLFAVGIALKHEPHFYAAGDIEDGAERKRLSIKFFADFLQMVADVKANDPNRWEASFSDGELNSFLQEDFVNYREADSLRKIGASDLRAAIDNDRIRLAFRYGSGFWSTVLSYDLRLWTVPKEPNVLVVEVLARRAGAVPLSSQSLVDALIELVNRHNAEAVPDNKSEPKRDALFGDANAPRTIEVTAYRYEGRPVALIRFQADQAHPSLHLPTLSAEPGRLRVTGAGAAPPAHQSPTHSNVTPSGARAMRAIPWMRLPCSRTHISPASLDDSISYCPASQRFTTPRSPLTGPS